MASALWSPNLDKTIGNIPNLDKPIGNISSLQICWFVVHTQSLNFLCNRLRWSLPGSNVSKRVLCQTYSCLWCQMKVTNLADTIRHLVDPFESRGYRVKFCFFFLEGPATFHPYKAKLFPNCSTKSETLTLLPLSMGVLHINIWNLWQRDKTEWFKFCPRWPPTCTHSLNTSWVNE